MSIVKQFLQSYPVKQTNLKMSYAGERLTLAIVIRTILAKALQTSAASFLTLWEQPAISSKCRQQSRMNESN